MKRSKVPDSTPQDLFWKHREALLLTRSIFDLHKGNQYTIFLLIFMEANEMLPIFQNLYLYVKFFFMKINQVRISVVHRSYFNPNQNYSGEFEVSWSEKVCTSIWREDRNTSGRKCSMGRGYTFYSGIQVENFS